MPIGEIAAAAAATIPAVNNALTLLERVGKVVKASTNLDAQEALVELRGALLSVKEENLAMREENLRLRMELESIRRAAITKSQIVFEYPNYYINLGDGTKDGPFCKSCKDKDEKLIRLTVRKPDAAWHCDVCKNNFETETQRRNIEAAIHRHNSSGSDDWMAR